MHKNRIIIYIIICLLNTAGISAQTQLGTTINGESPSDYFGNSTSLSGDGKYIAIGGYGNSDGGFSAGHVRVFEWNETEWVQRGSDIDGVADNDLSGWSVSLSDDGSIVAIGVPYHDVSGPNVGYVKVFEWDGSSWIQMGTNVNGEGVNDEFGWSVSISADGTRFAAGADYGEGATIASGNTRVFEWNGTEWMQMGSDINGQNSNDQSGFAVSLSGDGEVVAIGAPANDDIGSNAGHVKVYAWNGSEWIQRATDIYAETPGDQAGWSVDISHDGSVVAIGALNNDGNGFEAGQVRVFSWDGVSMNQKGGDIDGTSVGDIAGISVSLSADGNWVAIGASLHDGLSTDEGQARIFSWDGTAWNQIGTDLIGEEPYDNFGISVSLADDKTTFAVASILHNDYTGHVKVYDMSGFLAALPDVLSSDFSISPNPVDDILTVNFENEHHYLLSVFDIHGNLMHEQFTNKENISLNMSTYKKGIYLLRIFYEDSIINRKIIVQ